MSSIIVDLARPRNDWRASEKIIPSEIELPEMGMFRSLTLPNSSLCTDFIAKRSSSEWLGIAVAVSDDDLEYVEGLFGSANQTMCKVLKTPGRFGGIYSAYPDWNWLQITWSKEEPDWLVEVQTNGILWFADTSKYEMSPAVQLMVLEDVECLLDSSGEHLELTAFPVGSQSPIVKLAHL